MTRRFCANVMIAALAATIVPLAGARAQSAEPAARALTLTSPPPPPPAAEQIAAAVLPLPEKMRATARVLGYNAGGKLVELRPGAGGMTCLADAPGDQRFHVACYANAMEPFMGRGRELREQGVKGDQVDSVRFREVREGKLKMPAMPSTLYSLTGKITDWDAVTGKATGAARLYVVYIPGATSETTGLSAIPQKDGPWLMYPGTPKAHIMFMPGMSP